MDKSSFSVHLARRWQHRIRLSRGKILYRETGGLRKSAMEIKWHFPYFLLSISVAATTLFSERRALYQKIGGIQPFEQRERIFVPYHTG